MDRHPSNVFEASYIMIVPMCIDYAIEQQEERDIGEEFWIDLLDTEESLFDVDFSWIGDAYNDNNFWLPASEDSMHHGALDAEPSAANVHPSKNLCDNHNVPMLHAQPACCCVNPQALDNSNASGGPRSFSQDYTALPYGHFTNFPQERSLQSDAMEPTPTIAGERTTQLAGSMAQPECVAYTNIAEHYDEPSQLDDSEYLSTRYKPCSSIVYKVSMSPVWQSHTGSMHYPPIHPSNSKEKTNDKEIVSPSWQHQPWLNVQTTPVASVLTSSNTHTRDCFDPTTNLGAPHACVHRTTTHDATCTGPETPDSVNIETTTALWIEACALFDKESKKGKSDVVNHKVPPHSRKKEKRKHSCKEESVGNRKSAKSKSKVASCTIVKLLTPYNFFFRFERRRLLQCIDGIEDKALIANLRDADLILFLHEHMLPADYNDHFLWTLENSIEQQRQLLEEQWGRDASIKRVHCKSHGRFDFSSLTKHIAARWRTLPVDAKDVFRAISAQDYQRYNNEKS